MNLPVSAKPVLRGRQALASFNTYLINPQSCDIFKVGECVLEGAALVAGPCDPEGFPEDLVICIPAAAVYVAKCKDCIKGAVKDVICEAVSLAQHAGISVPQVLLDYCS
jgi:hypothetical protein